MFYFGRIISAFFNQLFRFLFWNKFGQKLLIILIICLISFWCLGMTKVHAVEEVTDTNYEAYSYYNSVVNDVIVQLQNYFNANGTDNNLYRYIIGNQSIPYFYYGNSDGSSYNGATPLSNSYINIVVAVRSYNYTKTASNYDYRGITGVTQYEVVRENNTISVYRFNNQGTLSTATINKFYAPLILFPYLTDNWIEYRDALINGDTATIVSLLEDIKADQQATNDFLSDTTMDDSNIDIPSPTLDSTTQSTDTSIHNSINTLTTSLQDTITNYYEGWDAYDWVIPMPTFIGGSITLNSGITRKIIPAGSVPFVIIQAIWVALFGGYIIHFVRRMIDWLVTGEVFTEGGIAKFVKYLEKENAVINASMM